MRGSRLVCIALSALAHTVLAAQSVPTLTASARNGELLLELGPIDLPVHNDRGSTPTVTARRIVVPAGGWMHGYSVEVVDRDGAPVARHLLHHVFVIAPHKRELFSADHLYIAAASGETDPLTLPRLIGYEMKKGDTLLVEGGLNDPAGHRWDGLRVRVHFALTPASSFIGAVAIYPFYVSVPAPPRADSAVIPPGRSESHWEGRPAVPGRILGLSGHAPTYAVSLRLEDWTTHKLIWEAHPDTNTAGQPKAIPVKKFVATFGVGIRPDHNYRLTVTYNNPSSTPIPATGGWGVLGGVFVLERGATWPLVNTVVK